MTSWRQADFAEVVQSRGSGTAGLPQSEWAPQGMYPVIGQGAEYVEGWTDRDDLLVRPNPALVLYGGHTRRAKFVNRPFVPGPNVKILEPAPELDAAFLFRYLEQLNIESRGYADHFPEVRRRRVPVPPLPEQRRIAEILDKADALRAERRAALAQVDTLTQSIFLDMFGDPTAHGWRTTTISHVASDADAAIRTGPFGSQLLHSEFTDDGIAVLGIDNAVDNEFRWGQRRFISEAKYRQLSRYTVHPGDVLITIMGTCGRCAIVPDDIPTAVNTKHLCCITLDRTKCLPDYLHAYFLRHPVARRYLVQKAKGAIMEGLNMGIIREMPIPLAPIDLQVEFAERLKQLGELREVQRLSEAELEALVRSLQYRAFRGEM